MANLRDTRSMTFDDTGGNEVTLEETDIQPYIEDPNLAGMEQEVALARHGGSPIQADPDSPQYAGAERGKYLEDLGAGEAEVGTGPKAAPTVEAEQPTKGGLLDVPEGFQGQKYDRDEFEKFVFKQTGGNPWQVDPIKRLEETSAAGMPALFGQVFDGKVLWADRELLNAEQKKHWNAEVAAFRADAAQTIDQDIRRKKELYNHMMGRFEDQKKQHEAAEIRTNAKIMAKVKQSKAYQKRRDELNKTKREIAKGLTRLAGEGAGYTTGKHAPGKEEKIELDRQLEQINQELETLKILMGEKKKPAPKPKSDLAGKQPAPAAAADEGAPTDQSAEPVYGTHKGRRVVSTDGGKNWEYEDENQPG